jgi:ceramide synthetase
MSNYMGWEGPRHLFLTEGLFVSVIGTWFYWRLYLYPFKVVHSVYAYGPQFYDQYLGVSFQYYGRHICIALLCVLAIMHIFWFFLICKIAVKLIKGTKAHDAGAEEYEGDSSDSGDEWEDEPGARRPPCIDFSRGAAELSTKQRAKKQAKRSKKGAKGAQ